MTILSVISRVAAAALLSGTATLFAGGTASAQTVLKFVSWQKDEKGVGDWWAEAIKEFERTHPGVKIEWTKVERNKYPDTMTTLFAGGNPPDIVHLASFEYQSFAERGWLEDLGPWLKQAGAPNLQGWAGQDTCVWKGKTNCVMLLYFGFIMAYNEALLKEAGVAVPKTYAEFHAAIRKLTVDKNKDGIIDQYGTGHETKSAGGQYLTEMLNYVLDAGAYWTDKDGKPAFDNPKMIEGLRRWKDVVRNSYTPRDLLSGDVRQLFAEGKIAIMVDGPWLYGIMQRAKPEVLKQLKITRPPYNPPVGGSSNVIGMASETTPEKKKLVWDFIRIVTSDAFQSKFASMAASTPPSPRADTTEAKKLIGHFDLLIETQKAAASAGVDRIPRGLEIQFNAFAKMVAEEAQRMIIQDLDPAAVAKTMQARALQIQQRR